MEIRTFAKRIFIVCSIFVIIVITIFYFAYYSNSHTESNCSIPTPVMYCGIPKLSEKALKGKKVFNETCAACHKMKFRATAPALGNTDSIIYWKWLGNRKMKIDTTKFDDFKIDYHQNFSRQNLNPKDLKNIYQYIKKY